VGIAHQRPQALLNPTENTDRVLCILPLLPVQQYRRAYIPGSIVFLTLVTYQRIPLFTTPTNITYLRQALNTVLVEMPF
jgi:hypothetical protein